METETVGHVALLPDGQRVKIEIIHDDGYATVRRTGGQWSGDIAVCAISKLEPDLLGLREELNVNFPRLDAD